MLFSFHLYFAQSLSLCFIKSIPREYCIYQIILDPNTVETSLFVSGDEIMFYFFISVEFPLQILFCFYAVYSLHRLYQYHYHHAIKLCFVYRTYVYTVYTYICCYGMYP